MSVNEQANRGTGPIAPGSPLARVLDGYGAPDLPAGFAERVLAAAEARPAPLPDLRRPVRSRRWRIGQRIAIGVASFGALASAAAATGLLEQLAIPVPSANKVWASLTGSAPAAAAPEPVVAAPAPAPTSAAVVIDGPIDTPEELQETFRRVDQVRAGRREERRAIIDQRIKSEIERRRAAGLPVPAPEEEARLRARIEQAVTAREQRADAAAAARREAMQRKVENGEALTREDMTGRKPVSPEARERFRGLRDLPPGERAKAWRELSPEERRALADELRARRAARLPQPPAPEPADVPAQDTPPPSE
ncbi:MAG: hypothetical protein NBV68_01600 [Erythrobacter sp.]|uniref:hypothetical protein n=1 Tax=Erythrobacter sp. TaxID=1042 RepID=UPI0025EA6314|nr:hypothetical protein [Erythrobacter sp.]MCL9998053.1 hypothetical protein [Erythrobacter sp.]